MSTRCTLKHGDDFHLYVDLAERGIIYLKLCGAEIEARPSCVTVGIPVGLWERLRSVTIVPDDWWDDDHDALSVE